MKTKESGDSAPHIPDISYQFEVSGQLPAPVTLPLRKELYETRRTWWWKQQARTCCKSNFNCPSNSITTVLTYHSFLPVSAVGCQECIITVRFHCLDGKHCSTYNTTQHKPHKGTPILTQHFGSWRSSASQILHKSGLSIQPTTYCICMYVYILYTAHM